MHYILSSDNYIWIRIIKQSILQFSVFQIKYKNKNEHILTTQIQFPQRNLYRYQDFLMIIGIFACKNMSFRCSMYPCEQISEN